MRVAYKRATGNVSGFEIETSAVRLDHNEADGNTGGILTFTLPVLDVKSNHDNGTLVMGAGGSPSPTEAR